MRKRARTRPSGRPRPPRSAPHRIALVILIVVQLVLFVRVLVGGATPLTVVALLAAASATWAARRWWRTG